MRIASGVILIIAAVLNLFAAFGYLAGGAATTALTEANTQAMQQAAQQTEELTEEEKAQIEEAQKALSELGGGSSVMFLSFGVFLLVAVGIMIAGAVFLFQGKKAGFIIAAGVIALLAEIIGILMTTFGPFNLIGIIAGILAIIAAKMMNPSPSGDVA